MADFDFYVNTYLGTQIQEKAFPTLAARAAGILESYQRRFRVEGGQQAQAMAVCAMAECLQEHQRRSCHESASVGNVSVRYQAPKEKLEKQLYRAASTFLDIYRGVC